MQITDFGDIVLGTLRHMRPGDYNFTQVTQELQSYEVMGKWLKKDRVSLESGIGVDRFVMIDALDVAKHAGEMDTDDVSFGDHMARVRVPWVRATVNWAFSRSEVLMNKGKALLYNVIKPRQTNALLSMAQVLEDAAWTSPATTEVTEPYGIPHWVVKNATTGFYGANPGSHTDCGGIDASTKANWRNYTAQFTTLSKTDGIPLLRTAHRKCRFISPISKTDMLGPKGEQYRVYCGEGMMQDFENLGEQQNENLGRDVASMDGTIVFRGHPIICVPRLDDTTAGMPGYGNPIYLINHKSFEICVLQGEYLVQSEPRIVTNMHRWRQVFVDLTYAYVCTNRRANAVICTAV